MSPPGSPPPSSSSTVPSRRTQSNLPPGRGSRTPRRHARLPPDIAAAPHVSVATTRELVAARHPAHSTPPGLDRRQPRGSHLTNAVLLRISAKVTGRFPRHSRPLRTDNAPRYAGRVGISFEWDAAKANTKARKHQVTFEEATTVFGDPLSVTIPDPLHSTPGDERFVTVGLSHRGRLLVVVHSDIGERVRIIGARSATRREQAAYEQEH